MSRLSLGKVTVNDLANRAPGDPAAPILTSPRSLRVCLERGVEPDWLVPRLPESFAKPELSAEHVKVKWERHERTRLQRVVALNKARDALPEAPDEEAPRVPGVAGAGRRRAGSRCPPVRPRRRRSHPSPRAYESFSVRTRRHAPALDVVAVRHAEAAARALRPTSAPAHAARGDSAVISAFQEEERRLEAARRRTEKQVVMMAAARRTADLRRAATGAKLARARRISRCGETPRVEVVGAAVRPAPSLRFSRSGRPSSGWRRRSAARARLDSRQGKGLCARRRRRRSARVSKARRKRRGVGKNRTRSTRAPFHRREQGAPASRERNRHARKGAQACSRERGRGARVAGTG